MITWWEALLLCCFIGWMVESRVEKVTQAIEKLGKDIHEDIKELIQTIESQSD